MVWRILVPRCSKWLTVGQYQICLANDVPIVGLNRTRRCWNMLSRRGPECGGAWAAVGAGHGR